jgi:hypothetical protein
MTYYKYCDERGVDILVNNRLRISPPNSFNDPFEFSPYLQGDVNPEKLSQDKGFRDHLWHLVRHHQGMPPTREEFEALLETNPTNTFARYAELLRTLFKENCARHLEYVSKDFSVMCLSRTASSILMWAHYARNHTGFVLGLNVANPMFPARDGTLFDVVYRNERCAIEARWDVDNLNWRQICEETLRVKYTDWSYEQEVRTMYFNQGPGVFSVTEGNRRQYYLPLDPVCISEIRIGWRASATLKEQLSEFCSTHRIPLFRATLSASQFALQFERLLN